MINKKIRLSNNTGVIKFEQLGYIRGAEILQRAIWRITHEDLLVSMSIKLRAFFLRRFVAIIISLKSKFRNDLLKKYLYKWRLHAIPTRTNNSEILKSKLKIVLLRLDNNNKKILSKYFNRWKYNKYSSQTKITIHHKNNGFCKFYKKWTKKRLLNVKVDMANSVFKKYIFEQGKNFASKSLRNIFKKSVIKRIIEGFKPLIKKITIEKIIQKTTTELKNNKNNFLISLIRKWRFITFVNALAKKKLELMYKNLHVSYLEMADEVFKGGDIVTPKELEEFSKYGNTYKFWDPNDSILLKELGIDPDASTKIFDDYSGFDKSNEVETIEVEKNKSLYKIEKLTKIEPGPDGKDYKETTTKTTIYNKNLNPKKVTKTVVVDSNLD